MAKIVIITSRFPFPLEKGDKLRIYNQIKYLSIYHEVFLIAIHHKKIDTDQLDMVQPYCREVKTIIIPIYLRILNVLLAFLGKLPFQVAYFFSNSKKRKIEEYIHHIKPDAIYSHLIRTSEYVKNIEGIRKTLDYMDCFSQGFQFKIKHTRNPFSKYLFGIEYKRLKKYEKDIFESFDEHCIISAQDRDVIPHPSKHTIHIIPNGVDLKIFHPIEIEKKYHLLFSGNMGYRPNIDAANYAALEILPLLIKKYPFIKLLIAGIHPPPQIKKLAGPNIIVIEEFTNISDAFAQSKINLAPVITSIGLQNKILQGMAMKIPCVTTLAGARGIGAENKNIVLIGHSKEELAEHIISLLENEKLYTEISENAFNYIHDHFQWDAQNKKLLELILGDNKPR